MEGIPLGPIVLRWNGVLIMIGFALGGVLSTREVKRRGYDPGIVLDLAVPLLIWGTVGARLWHVFTPSLSSAQLGLTTGYYLTHPLDLFAIWIGGLGFPGALLGGLFALFLFSRKYELDFPEWADILTPGLILGQIIGRLGNYFNQELYGLPAHVPWQVFISPEHRLAGYESVDFYHPLFAYEMGLNLLLFFVLMGIHRRFDRPLRAGDLFLAYLFGHGMIRFFLEFLRLDVSLVGQVNVNQIFAVMLMLISVAIFTVRTRSMQKL
jgi:phosphatidylglycerol:prolipoprotein diacylglycerol transferase